MPERRKNESGVSEDKRGANRRAFPRWRAPIEVKYQVAKEQLIGTPVEIGEGGLSFIGHEPIQRETELTVEYRLIAEGIEPEWVKVKSIVRHSDGKITGVEFLNLRRADRLKIVDFVMAMNK
jgi:hypothetical protein